MSHRLVRGRKHILDVDSGRIIECRAREEWLTVQARRAHVYAPKPTTHVAEEFVGVLSFANEPEPRRVAIHMKHTRQESRRPVAVSAIFVLLGALCPVYAENVAADPGLLVHWTHPPWASPSKPFRGAVAVANSGTASLQCHYQYPNGQKNTVACTPKEGEPETFIFAVPPPKKHSSGMLEFWLEEVIDSTDTKRSLRRSVPYSDETEIEVSGQTDVELTFALKSWDVQLLFKPCCLIVSGWIEAERIPVLPTSSRDGLPDMVLSPFYRLEPDDLVKATGGVKVKAHYGGEAAKKVKPESIRAYQWKEGSWSPVLDPVHDLENRTITFRFAYGGTFVIAGEPLF